MSRETFRQRCVEREGGECIVPWCRSSVVADPDGPGDVHHIIERKLWDDGGYIPENGVAICNDHHQLAEANEIPPQAFWRWIGLEEVTVPNDDPDPAPDMLRVDIDEVSVDAIHIDKWGEPFETPPWTEHREYSKYPSTRHLMPLY